MSCVIFHDWTFLVGMCEMFNDNVKMLMMIMMVLKESHPDKYTEHCWNVENRGAVGETTFHVCFLMGTPTHMYCAKRILKWFPEVSPHSKCV